MYFVNVLGVRKYMHCRSFVLLKTEKTLIKRLAHRARNIDSPETINVLVEYMQELKTSGYLDSFS